MHEVREGTLYKMTGSSVESLSLIHILQFFDGVSEVVVFEELDPVIERELVYLCGKHHLNVQIRGKQTGDVQNAGENSTESVEAVLRKLLGCPLPQEEACLLYTSRCV